MEQFITQGFSGIAAQNTTLDTSLNKTQSLTQLPTVILDTLVPGYSTVRHLLLSTLGFDITALVSISLLLFALFKAFDYIHFQTIDLIKHYATSSLTISSEVDAYSWLMDFFDNRGIGIDARNISASNGWSRLNFLFPYETAFETFEEEARLQSRRGKPPVQVYEPDVGLSHYFWHHGRLFLWQRSEKNVQDEDSRWSISSTIIMGKLYCLGRSTAPLKALMDEAAAFNHAKSAKITLVRRPASKLQRERGSPWKVATVRPSREMSTVALGEQEKSEILKDMEEYLLPETRTWYSQRGIPYRRGYLFHGSPGTGKTSLSFALAGVFELEIFVISLQEPTITEEDLTLLFEQLPQQCLVLLEDVDSAGLVREGEKGEKGRISLSGLLNVVDGVASHEGRLLVMTTNHIEKLDEALLRPGRIDVKVLFELATRKQAEDLFIQIFAQEPVVKEVGDARVSGNAGVVGVSDESELKDMASAFADQIPEKEFSPADIQGYLIKWKKSPKEAVKNAGKWVEGSLMSK